MRVLVIDDNQEYAKRQCVWLKQKGYDSKAVHTKEETLEYLEQEGNTIDIALVDMYMGTDKESGLRICSASESFGQIECFCKRHLRVV